MLAKNNTKLAKNSLTEILNEESNELDDRLFMTGWRQNQKMHEKVLNLSNIWTYLVRLSCCGT